MVHHEAAGTEPRVRKRRIPGREGGMAGARKPGREPGSAGSILLANLSERPARSPWFFHFDAPLPCCYKMLNYVSSPLVTMHVLLPFLVREDTECRASLA